MEDSPFKPAGVAFAAVVAGLGAGAVAPAAEVDAAGGGELSTALDVSTLPAAEPFGANPIDALEFAEADVPFADPVQLTLPLERA